jgi:hypothetical protein
MVEPAQVVVHLHGYGKQCPGQHHDQPGQRRAQQAIRLDSDPTKATHP